MRCHSDPDFHEQAVQTDRIAAKALGVWRLVEAYGLAAIPPSTWSCAPKTGGSPVEHPLARLAVAGLLRVQPIACWRPVGRSPKGNESDCFRQNHRPILTSAESALLSPEKKVGLADDRAALLLGCWLAKDSDPFGSGAPAAWSLRRPPAKQHLRLPLTPK